MKEKLLEVAREILEQADSEGLESIEINTGETAGSKEVTIRLSFLPELPDFTGKKRTKVDGMDVLEQLNK